MENEDQTLWLGTQASYLDYLAAEKSVVTKASEDVPSAGETPWLVDVQGSVAVINVAGSLISGEAGWGRYYGETGYDDIRKALAFAVSNPAVGSIVLNVTSGGGHVAGVHETAQLIRRVDKVKPVVTYAGADMASAALWLGVSARKVFASETAQVGSIGILVMHADRSKQLEEAGIKVTVIRAGSEKTLATPYEPLSEKAKANLQAKADALYDIFIGHVAEARGVTVTAADTKFGQGRVFLGQEAKDRGLVDQVGLFEDAMSAAAKLGDKAVAKVQQRAPQQGLVRYGLGATNSAVPALSQAALEPTLAYSAAIAAQGAAPNPQKGILNMEPMTDEQLAAMAGVDLTAEAATQEPAAPEVAAKPAVEPTTPAEPAAQSALALVKEMLAEAQTNLATARAENATLKAQSQAQVAAKAAEVDAAKAETGKFVEIARASVKTMGMHFGLSSDAVAALTTAEVLSEHARLSEAFKAKYKAGRVAATASEVATKATNAVPLVFAAMTNHAK
jgi:signal peptide peptidase SppA